MKLTERRGERKLEGHFNYRSLSESELNQYEEKGYLVLDGILSQSGLEAIVDQCMAAWTAEKGEFDPGGTWLENSLLTDIHHRSPLVRDYYFEGPLVNVAEQIIGPNIKEVTSQLTFKMRGNTKPFPWHQDNGYGELDRYNSITCLTALEDNDEANGCLWIIPGSHKQGQRRAGLTVEEKKAQVAIEDKPDESMAVPMPLKAGQCLIFNCWMLHRSDGNLSIDRDRRVLFLRYADADAVEVYNDRKPRPGRLVRGTTQFSEVAGYEAAL
jgi:hypothetical protein